MPLKPNDLLHGQYRILGQLGRGGFGFIYHALDTLISKPVAIKELIPALVGDEAILKRFLSEARATMELRDERIVATHTIFPDGDNYYIVMEYLPHGSLEDLLRQQRSLPINDALRIAAQVCEGLGYAHARGIVHCDLKPANILFASDGSAKLADFGIAYVSDETLSRSWRTPAGFVAGTLPYMSPEQADGCRSEPRTDLYALGAVLYRMLTGRTYLDFDPRDTPRVQSENIQRIYCEHPVPPSAHNPCIPVWIDEAILKALSKNPVGRYPDADSFLNAISPTQPRQVTPKPAPRPELATVAKRRPGSYSLPRWLLLSASGSLLLLIAISLGLFFLLKDQRPVPEPTQSAYMSTTPTSAIEPDLIELPSATRKLSQPADTNFSPQSTSTNTPAPSVDTFPPTPTRAPTRTPAPEPAFLDGGRRIAFTSTRDGNYEIYIMNADGSSQTRLTQDDGWDEAPAWSPDGTRIAFQSNRDGNFDIYVINADGSGVSRITSNSADDQEPSWSPDGSHIAFVSYRRGRAEIFVMNSDGSGQTRLTNRSASIYNYRPAWSPDGGRIALSSGTFANYDIYVMNSDGSGLAPLTDSAWSDRSPAWSPNGRYIAFRAERDANSEIYVMHADGSAETNLTNNPANDFGPAWSPDGGRIAFYSYRDGNWEIYIMNADGSNQTRLTRHPELDADPAWSP